MKSDAENLLILVINCGSSSIKFDLLDPVREASVLRGIADALGSAECKVVMRNDGTRSEHPLPGAGHQEALNEILRRIESATGSLDKIAGIGHRTVHGADRFSGSVRLNAEVIAQIEACVPLAPLHNPANLIGIKTLTERLPEIPQVGVFDTAFHQSLPRKAFLYAIPYHYYAEHRVRRYGFHGTSHKYVAGKAAELLKKPLETLHLITVHLGNGCSATAVANGKSVDTSMGMTPLEGLVMGTRSGDVDPGLFAFMADRCGYSINEINTLLNKKSGLLGLSELSNDMRVLTQAMDGGDDRAARAIEVFCYRLAKTILALGAALERIDAIVFTGGIGENSAPTRASVMTQLAVIGARLDPEANAVNGRETHGRISRGEGPVCLVVPTNEELMIARETANLI